MALRARAGRALLAERLAAAAMPAVGIALIYLCLALYGFGSPALFAACLALVAAACVPGAVRLRRPRPDEIDRRIETASGLAHRPLAALDDRLESTDPLALALWRAHQARGAAVLAGARAGWPVLGSATGDPWALRGLLLLLLLIGIVSAGPAATGRLGSAFALPSWPFAAPRVDLWVSPPDYADAPPMLIAPGGAITTLAGSRLSVLVNGTRHLPPISLPGTRFAGTELTASSHRADAVLTASGRLVIGPWWHRLGHWQVSLTPPASPSLRLRGLSVLADGRLQMSWTARDPYGLLDASVAIAPMNAPAALPQRFALPTGTGDRGAVLDLANDPLDGLPSTLIFTVRNRANVATQYSPGLMIVPPMPMLSELTAAALFPQRQALALRPGEAAAVARRLAELARAPPSAISASVDLQLAALASALAAGRASREDAVRRLGLLIRQIEDQPDTLAARALAKADQALMAALKRGLNGHAADAARLRDLLQQISQALAQRLATAPRMAGAGGTRLDLATLDQLAQRIAADEAAGRMEQARQEMAALGDLLKKLQNARPQSPAEAARDQARTAAAQSIAGLTAAEAKLRDATAVGAATASQQAVIARGLARAAAAAGQAGLTLPSLNAAAGAMAAAGQALGQRDTGGAEAAEATAIQALQKAAAGVGAATPPLSISNGEAPAGDHGEGDGSSGADEDSTGFRLPAANPADAIQERILREDAAPSLPAPTHQYLRRLLDPTP